VSAQKNGDDQLAKLYPAPVAVRLHGEPFDVYPMPISRIARVAKALRPLIEQSETLNFAALLAQNGEELVSVMATAIDKPVDVVGSMLPDEFVALFQAVMKVNQDFFVSRVLPLLSGAQAKTMTDMLGAGQTRLHS